MFAEYGKNALYSDGLVVKTSINTQIQKFADESLLEGIINYEKSQGWNGVIENTSNENFIEKQTYYDSLNPFLKSWIPTIIINTKDKKLFLKDSNNFNYDIDLNDKENKWLLNEKFEKGDVLYIEKLNSTFVIRQIPKVNGAIVVLNPHNGDVLALSGGYSFKISEFNRATQAKRQPGSAFKPFVYITALQEGYTPSTLILDALM